MRDLEFAGGNILGTQQSGHHRRGGLRTLLPLLEGAVQQLNAAAEGTSRSMCNSGQQASTLS